MQIYEEEQIQFKKQLNHLETYESNECYVDLMGLPSILKQDTVTDKDREGPLEHFGAPDRKEVKTFHADRTTPERHTTIREYQDNGLDRFDHQKYLRSEKLNKQQLSTNCCTECIK